MIGPMPKLSLAMIVKNESANLPRCLRSVQGLVDEIIVVDTGSTDDTVAIAESFGAKVYHFQWIDDFAAARNESLRRCTGDWVLVLDGDESVDALDHGLIRKACTDDGPAAYFLTLRSYFRDAGGVMLDQVIRPNDTPYQEGSEFGHYADFPSVRLSRRYPDLCFEGRIHELLATYFLQRKLPVGTLEAVIHHFGKVDLAREAEKKVRYLRMAQDQTEADPRNSQAWFNVMIQAATARDWRLVVEAGETFLALQQRPPITVLTTVALGLQETARPAEAIPYLKRALLASPRHALANTRLAVSLAQTGHAPEGLRLLERFIRQQPELPAPRLALAEIQLNTGRLEEARQTLKESIAVCPQDPGLRERQVKLDLQLGLEAQASLDAWAALGAIPNGGGGLWHALVAGFLLKSGETGKGSLVLEQGLRIYPEHPSLLNLRKLTDSL